MDTLNAYELDITNKYSSIKHMLGTNGTWGILDLSVSNSTATVASTVDGISMFIDATNGGTVARDGVKSQAYRTADVTLYFPCSVGDGLTINGYTGGGYSGYTVGNDVAEHSKTYVARKIRQKDMVDVNNLTGDIKSGVETIIESSGKSGAIASTATTLDYFYGYVLSTYTPLQEKCLYSSTFDEWDPRDANTTDVVIAKKTKYSGAPFTFTLHNTEVDNVNNNTGKFAWSHGYLMAGKNTGDSADDGTVTISELSSVTSVHFYEGVTGGTTERGWGLKVKGADDSDWVTVFSEVAGGTYRDVTVDINRTNCSLLFYNLCPSENAYMFQLDIYGELDFSTIPSLDYFTLNDTDYYGDIFEEDADGNMVATIELFSSETMVSSSNVITNITGEGTSAIGEVTYTDQADDTCTVTIPVTLDGTTVNFIVYVVRKPWYTLTYYNSDGTALTETQSVEKDTEIGTFIHDETEVTVESGKAFRGWAEALTESRKYTTSDIVTSDLSLYALVTDIEYESAIDRYVFNLQQDYFDADDHEAFNPSGDGYWHDSSHGWAFNGSGSIDILVGGNAFIIMSLCQYSNTGSISLFDADGNKVCADIDVKVTTDGTLGTFQYEGQAGKLTIQFDATGEVYLHKLTIANTANLAIDSDGEYIVVPIIEGQTDVDRGNTLLSVIDIANAQSTDNGRVYVFLPDGTYDLGEECLTQISRANISIIGQSTAQTYVVNKAPVEGIAVSATLLNTSTGLYMQDLTLKNAYDYYGLSGDGRADCFQDKGANTICKNVRMLSYQDTYYSNCDNNLYFEDSEIHGIVDYICGSGNVFFSGCTLYNEGRGGDNVAGSSSQYCYITAPNTASSCQFGYVFDSCTVTGTQGQTYCYGRSWNNSPRCVWINTTLADPSCIIAERWRLEGMNNCVPTVFAEYGTVDASGNDAMPTTTVQTFFGEERTIVLTADEAKEYSYETFSKTLGWDPQAETLQVEIDALTFTGQIVSWTGNTDAKCYAVFVNGIFQDFTKETSYTLPADVNTVTDHICIRAANQNGGLGPNLENFTVETQSAISQVCNDGAELVATAYYDLSGRRLTAPERGINIAIEYYSDGSQKTTRVLTK